MDFLETLKALLVSPTVRRLAVTMLTGGIISLNHKAGLNLDTADIGGLVTLAVAYLAQSVTKDRAAIISQAKAAGEEAAAKVQTVDDAAKVLSIKPEVKP